MTAFRSVISQLHCWAGNSFFYHKRATKLAQSRVPLPCSEKAEDVPGEDRAAGGAAARRPGGPAHGPVQARLLSSSFRHREQGVEGLPAPWVPSHSHSSGGEQGCGSSPVKGPALGLPR